MNTSKAIDAVSLGLLLAPASCLARPQNTHEPASQEQGHEPSMPGMPGMNMGQGGDDHTESDAMRAMQHAHMDSAHMRMTPPEKASPEDIERANQIVAALRQSIEKYKDYHVALAEGYRIFLPNVPQPMYHFTNYWNGFLEAISFDPSRPTSLLYTKTKDGYQLIGAMYTAPKNASLEQLNERVPLGVARWHAHTNLCLPQKGEDKGADRVKFGLNGSISTPEACAAAGGRFYPQIFGWMVHAYPFESSPDKVWAH